MTKIRFLITLFEYRKTNYQMSNTPTQPADIDSFT